MEAGAHDNPDGLVPQYFEVSFLHRKIGKNVMLAHIYKGTNNITILYEYIH